MREVEGGWERESVGGWVEGEKAQRNGLQADVWPFIYPCIECTAPSFRWGIVIATVATKCALSLCCGLSDSVDSMPVISQRCDTTHTSGYPSRQHAHPSIRLTIFNYRTSQHRAAKMR